MADVETYLANIANKSGEDVNKLRTEYGTILETIPPGAKREEKALRELNKKYVADKSSAVSKNFVVVGIGDLMDYNSKRHDEALELYASKPQEALEKNVVRLGDSGNPIPLDTREFLDKNGKYKNNNFGKDLLPQYARNTIVLMKGEDGSFTKQSLTLRGKKAQEISQLPPMNCEIKARLLGDEKKGYSTSDKATNYETVEVLSEGTILDLLAKSCTENMKVLGDCESYHRGLTTGTQEYYGRFVVTDGDVNFANETDEGKKSNFMVIDDITINNTVNCFVPKHIQLPDAGKRVNVIAQTNIGKKWDSENKRTTDEDVLQLNVMGIISS